MTVVFKLKYILKLSFTNNSVRGLRSQFDKDENSINNSLRPVFLTAQFGGIMPLSDIETRGKFPKFEWRSSRTLYACVRFAGSILLASFHIHKMSEMAITLQNMRLLIFLTSGMVTSVNFFVLARKWPLLIRKIQVVDLEISKVQEKSNLRRTVRVAFLIYMLVAAIEHCLEDIHKISLIKTCGLNFSKSVEIFLKHFIIPDVFTIISYTFVWGIILEIMSLLLTFSWTFIDIFIILISWCLAERFFQITRRVKFLVRTRVSDEKQWEKIRNDYIRLCQLCRLLDEELSFIILQSFASNMFFILTQLFNSFQFKAYLMEKIYFCFSFFTLILRMFFVCVVAGMVNGESSKPLVFLSEAPTTIYNKQIQRFAEYIHWNNISLTGRRYFIITKGLLLNITGAIITYELVLLQFEGHTIIPNEVNEISRFFNCDNLLDNDNQILLQ